jgi:hypothetical protein
LKEGVSAEEVRTAIAGAAKAAFVDDNGRRHDDIELICRNRVKLDSFIARAHAHSNGNGNGNGNGWRAERDERLRKQLEKEANLAHVQR